jgi:3-isopropylmalate/(R)-2-methylmalate dehydratase small subunit
VISGFRELRSQSVVLRQSNIDTDQIIPARFLSTTERAGLGRNAFNDWRWQADGTPYPEFPFNQPENAGRAGLLAGTAPLIRRARPTLKTKRLPCW